MSPQDSPDSKDFEEEEERTPAAADIVRQRTACSSVAYACLVLVCLLVLSLVWQLPLDQTVSAQSSERSGAATR
jgi:hypothetical protein